MRDAFCKAMTARAGNPSLVFLTGDLGFMALEPLRDALGSRFINCGVAEQNMVGVAAGLAREGLDVWVYSIAPFCVLRPFEQIRNDVAFHRLPVHFVGNGGGYGYGVMGASHHTLEDYGVMLTLPGMCVEVPVADCDVAPAIDRMAMWQGPAYLRLGRQEGTGEISAYVPWRRLRRGTGPIVVACGPIALALVPALDALSVDPEVWVVSEMTSDNITAPSELVARLKNGAPLAVVEEHGAQGSLASQLAQHLLQIGAPPSRFVALTAQGYPSQRYGSQAFHRRESSIDPVSVAACVEDLGRAG